ncbi:hypothetical protein [Labilibacter marinus]|uniref:hypothetical protein n=1 Tax=Labilibacter marinus TaxID=1477105 RepID=UPI0008362D77|nr:hypothetical protein [Labilibacter marinus]
MRALNFNFTIAELNQRADKLVISYKRDENEFKSYGYNGEAISQIEGKTEFLKSLLSDDYYAGLQRMATDNKNQIRQDLETNISDFRNRSKLALGANSIEYSLFNFSKLNSLKDNELVQYVLHINTTAQPLLQQLSKRLISQKTLDSLMQSREKLDDAIDMQSTAVSERREKKVKRTQLANELYTFISELCEVGKLIWKGNNEAFYTDYVIYGSSKAIEEQNDEMEELEYDQE